MPDLRLALRSVARFVDSKPWVAHVYVTEQCNLDCHYCNEYDNSIPHPPVAEVKRWLDKLRDLGVLRIGFQGGEPLMHPDLPEIIRYAKHDLGFVNLSMSTNGFLLTAELVRALEEAGLDKLQLSVDRMTPIASTRKSLRSVAGKLDLFRGSRIRLQISGVLFEDTADELAEVIRHALERGVRVHARLAHADGQKGAGVKIHDRQRMLGLLDHQAQLKAQGEKIHSSWNTLDYQRRTLHGQPIDWTCTAGYKYFFVSARGHFWPCSQVRTERHILDLTPADLLAYRGPKPCQEGCGVYCIVETSRLLNHPLRFAAHEGAQEARARLRRLVGPGPAPASAPPVSPGPD